MLAEEMQSALAAAGAPLAERYTHHHNMLLLEAALEKARRAHRPLIITSLGTPANDPSQIHMDPCVLNALDMQVRLAAVPVSLVPVLCKHPSTVVAYHTNHTSTCMFRYVL